MDIKKSLQYNYVFEALPMLFHSQTNGFMQYIEKDGLDFLRFWWNHVGDKLPQEKRVSASGLNYEVKRFDEKTRIVYITLPMPKDDQEAYFLACVARPERRFSFVRIPNSHVFVLRRDDSVTAEHRTAFGALTPRAIYRQYGVGLNPTKQDFQRIVENRLRKGKKK